MKKPHNTAKGKPVRNEGTAKRAVPSNYSRRQHQPLNKALDIYQKEE